MSRAGSLILPTAPLEKTQRASLLSRQVSRPAISHSQAQSLLLLPLTPGVHTGLVTAVDGSAGVAHKPV